MSSSLSKIWKNEKNEKEKRMNWKWKWKNVFDCDFALFFCEVSSNLSKKWKDEENEKEKKIELKWKWKNVLIVILLFFFFRNEFEFIKNVRKWKEWERKKDWDWK